MNDFLKLLSRLKKQANFKKLFYKAIAKRGGSFIFFLPIALLFVVFLAINLIRLELRGQLQQIVLSEPLFSDFSPAAYPKLSTSAFGYNVYFPDITANGAIIMDDKSKVVLFSKNQEKKFSMASTTKIMTALVALDHYTPDDMLSVKRRHNEGVTVGLQPGQKFYFLDLLYAMLLPSGNDAAKVIAENYPGGELAFVKEMNDKAKNLFLSNTYFVDPTGLNKDDQTTVVDLARLASYAMRDQRFSTIVQTKQRTISDVSGEAVFTLFNLNKLLGYYNVTGVKTGFTDEAGGILVTSRQDPPAGGQKTIIVVMKSVDRFADTERLLAILDQNITYQPIRP